MTTDIEYFNTLSYTVILKKKGAKFTLCIPELSCVVEDDDLAIAYEKLESRKQELFQDMVSADLSEAIRKPDHLISNETAIKPLFLFLSKAVIGCGVLFFATFMTIYVVHDTVKQFTPLGPLGLIRSQVSQVKHGLESMPDEEKEEIRIKIRETLQELKPFLDEFDILRQEPTE
jgi:hypothetical protein